MSMSFENSPEIERKQYPRVKRFFFVGNSPERPASSELRAQALKDLTARARGGIFVYLPVWLFIALWYDLESTSSVFFWVNTSILTLLALARLLHYRLTLGKAEHNIGALYVSLRLLALSNALHWGLLTAWILIQARYTQLHLITMILVSAFGFAGAMNLSIDHALRVLFPIFIYVPTIISLLVLGSKPEYNMLATLATFSVIYILYAAKITGHDYWEAVKSHQDAMQTAIQLERLSTTDALTQLDNRMSFDMRYGEEWKRCSRHGLELGVLMIDLDRLKQLNDTYGHMFGDECLREVARTLRRNISRDTDLIARYGGDEFIALLPGTDMSGATQVAERLVRNIREIKISYDREAVSLTCSIGISCAVPDYGEDIDLLIRVADRALYEAKSNGRNQWYSAG